MQIRWVEGYRLALRVLVTMLLLILLVVASLALAPGAAAHGPGGRLVVETASGSSIHALEAAGSGQQPLLPAALGGGFKLDYQAAGEQVLSWR